MSLKEKILETVHKNSSYKNLFPNDEETLETSSIELYSESPENIEEEVNNFKDKILNTIQNNIYFKKYIIGYENDNPSSDEPLEEELAKIASFVTADNKVLLSACDKVIAF